MDQFSLLEQGTGLLNEDCRVVQDNFFAVFDGATSLTPVTYGHGRTGGWQASHIAARVLQTNDKPLPDLVAAASAFLCTATNKPISIAMVNAVFEYKIGLAMAYGTVLIVLTAVLGAVIGRFRPGLRR